HISPVLDLEPNSFPDCVRPIGYPIAVTWLVTEKKVPKPTSVIEVTASGADPVSCNKHPRPNDDSFRNRIAQGDIDEVVAARDTAPQIWDSSEPSFNCSPGVWHRHQGDFRDIHF